MMVSHPGFKFSIGFIAGGCAVLFPKVAAVLSIGEETPILTGFFLQWASLFALLIGVIVAILEWNVPKEPGATFMAALGIPAILAGGVNSTVDNVKLDKLRQSNEQLIQVLSDAVSITTRPNKNAPSTDHAAGGMMAHSWYFQWVDAAHARVAADSYSAPLRTQFVTAERRYVIILDTAPDIVAAKVKAEKINRTIPSLQTDIIRNGDEYLVIENGPPMTKADALIKAVRIKRDGLSPQLFEMK